MNFTISDEVGEPTRENNPSCSIKSAATISSITPTSGPPGTIVTVNGTGFVCKWELTKYSIYNGVYFVFSSGF